MRLLRLITLLLLIACPTLPAEISLEVLLLRVDDRFVAPTCERALSKDPAGLEDAITKLRALAPDRGVTELVHIGLSSSAEEIRERAFSLHPHMPDEALSQIDLGYEFEWKHDRHWVYRILVHKEVDDEANPMIVRETGFYSHHHLHEHWTLSSAIKQKDGALFFFERLSESDLRAVPPEWTVISFHQQQPSSPRREDFLTTLFTEGEPHRAALVRFPAPAQFPGKVVTHLHWLDRFPNDFKSEEIQFNTWIGKAGPDEPKNSQIIADLLYTESESEFTRHKMNESAVAEAFPQIFKIEPKVFAETRTENARTSTEQKETNAIYYMTNGRLTQE